MPSGVGVKARENMMGVYMYIGSGAYRETDRQTDHLKSCQTVSSSPAKLFFFRV